MEATLAEPKCFPLQKNRTASPHPKSALGGGRLIHSKGARTSAGQILLGPSPRPFPPLQRAGRSQTDPGPGRDSDMARELLPRGAAPPPNLEKYSPRTSPRAACARARRPRRLHSCLAGLCYRRSSRR
jgi:hypothetical protein